MSAMVTLDLDCAACGALIATVTMENYRIGPELDGREFFCQRCQYGGLPASQEDAHGEPRGREDDR